MPRPRFRRELCDCLDCVDPSRRVDPAEQAVRHSAALQDPPPKCLIVFADGTLLPASQEAGPPGTVTSLNRAHHPHLDGMARDGCSGLLAVQSPAAGSDRPPLLERLAQLFSLDAAARSAASSPPDLASRYQQLAAAFVSADGAAVELSEWAGFQRAMHLSEMLAGQHNAPAALSDAYLPAPGAVAAAALGLLGLDRKAAQQAPAAEEDSDEALHLLLLHLGPQPNARAFGAAAEEQFADSCTRVEWLDALVQQLNAQPGARESLLLVVVLGSGGASIGELLRPGGSGVEQQASNGGVGGLRPRQSFQMCKDEAVAVDLASPLLMVQRLPAVVRVDRCSQLSLEQYAQRGGASAILAERLLPELAYKLGRAPKYGA